MLGRRRNANAADSEDITDRIRRRTAGGLEASAEGRGAAPREARGPVRDTLDWRLIYKVLDEVSLRLDKALLDRGVQSFAPTRISVLLDEALETLMLVACESMRGHLVGPERTGDFDLIETDDRFILRFDPCGSGQRTVQGDWVEGTPPRMEPPYNWAVTTEEASWNHYTKGICLYCVHCIILMEEMPMDRFGYPVRTVDPPVFPDTDRDPDVRQQCQWEMFKDPTQVPEEYYTRVGRKKPKAFGSSNFQSIPLPDAGSLGLPGTG